MKSKWLTLNVLGLVAVLVVAGVIYALVSLMGYHSAQRTKPAHFPPEIAEAFVKNGYPPTPAPPGTQVTPLVFTVKKFDRQRKIMEESWVTNHAVWIGTNEANELLARYYPNGPTHTSSLAEVVILPKTIKGGAR